MKCYILTCKYLTNRKKYIETLLQYVSDKFEVEVINTDIPYSKKVKLQQCGIEEFDKALANINQFMADNIERHRLVYSKIKDDETCLILEDDNVMLNDHIDNVKDFIKNHDNIMQDYDIGIVGLTVQNQPKEKIQFNNYRLTNNPNIIASKSAYMINGKLAKRLYDYLDDHKYSMRVQLSKFLYDNLDVKVGIINKHIFIEGSKIGIVPTSFNKNNLLIFNPDYIRLLQLMNENGDIKVAEEIFKKLKAIDSVDAYHLMAIFYHKNNLNDRAFEYFETAFKLLKEQNGYLGKDSEILNNTINIYQYNQ